MRIRSAHAPPDISAWPTGTNTEEARGCHWGVASRAGVSAPSPPTTAWADSHNTSHGWPESTSPSPGLRDYLADYGRGTCRNKAPIPAACVRTLSATTMLRHTRCVDVKSGPHAWLPAPHTTQALHCCRATERFAYTQPEVGQTSTQDITIGMAPTKQIP